MTELAKSPPKTPRAVLLRISEDQGVELYEEALRLTEREGRFVSPTEVVRRRTFGIGSAA